MSRTRRLRSALARAYLSADPRSLALGRICLALVLLLDLAKRVPGLETWYTNEGLLPNHTLLWRPTFQWVFSFFYMASWTHEAVLGFLFCGFCYLALLVGYRTRTAHLLSVICVLSLHGRVLFLQNGGDVVLSGLCLWTACLPTGRRFSVDSLLARLRARPETHATELGDRWACAPDTRRVVSFGVLALVIQLAVIYFFKTVHRTEDAWREGSVVHYLLHQDRTVTTLGLWVREHMGPGLSKMLTWSMLSIEGLAPLLLLSPIARRGCRRLAVLLLLSLHVGFALFLNLGLFSISMIAFFPNLIAAEDWHALGRWWKRRQDLRRVVVFDADCGFCFQVVRCLSRLDTAGHLTFVGNDAAELPAGVDRALTDETIVVLHPDGRRWLRARGFTEILRALPFGATVAWLTRLPLADSLYDFVARRRTAISIRLGLAACGIPGTSLPSAPIPVSRPRFPGLGGGVAAMLAVVALSQVLGPRQPQWMQAAVSYLQLFQGRAMLAPDAPFTDMNVYVDAVTSDGRHMDPLNAEDRFFRDYVARIARRTDYHQALTDWILRQGFVSFEAFTVEDDSPPPGEREPRNVRVKRFLRHPR